jgi:hypothetical protein
MKVRDNIRFRRYFCLAEGVDEGISGNHRRVRVLVLKPDLTAGCRSSRGNRRTMKDERKQNNENCTG